MYKKISFYFILIFILFLSSCKSQNSLEALKRGRLNDLKEFYKKGDKLEYKLKSGDTFLTYAIKEGYDDISLWLIKNKIVDLNLGDDLDNTPIVLAYRYDRKRVFNELLKIKNIDLNKKNFYGVPLVAFVVQKGDYDLFIKLVKKYKVKKRFIIKDGLYEGYGLVQFATEGGNIDILEYLRKHRFSFRSRGNLTYPMFIAAQKGDINTMAYLDGIGLRMKYRNKEGWTVLMSAAKSGDYDAVMLVLGYGANVKAKTKSGWTALMSAVIGKNLEVVKLLVDSGAEIAVENNEGKNAVEIAIDENNNDIADFLRKKLKSSK